MTRDEESSRWSPILYLEKTSARMKKVFMYENCEMNFPKHWTKWISPMWYSTEIEMKMLIEAAVCEFNKVFESV